MARPKKEITLFKEALANLSYRERLKLYVNTYFGDYDPLAEEKINLITKSFSVTERNEFNSYYYPIFSVMIGERERFRLASRNVEYYSLYLNNLLLEIDIYKHSTIELNLILSRIAAKAESETPEEKTARSSYSSIASSILNMDSIFFGVKLEKENYHLSVNSSLSNEEINKAITAIKSSLRKAKGLSIALKEFAEAYKVLDLIPDEIKKLEEIYKGDLSLNWQNSSRIYREYSQKPNKTEDDNLILDLIGASVIYPTLFPDYESTEPEDRYIGKNNIFISQCAAKRKK